MKHRCVAVSCHQKVFFFYDRQSPLTIAHERLLRCAGDACDRVASLQNSKFFTGHKKVVGDMVKVICNHLLTAVTSNRKPLSLVLYGPTGTGKSLFQDLLKDTLESSPHRLSFFELSKAGLIEAAVLFVNQFLNAGETCWRSMVS